MAKIHFDTNSKIYNYGSASDVLIFLHIPKTAGSTFHHVLNKRYGKSVTHNVFGSRYSEPEISNFVRMEAHEKAHIRLLKGHMPFGLHNYLPESAPAKYISMLRNPVERVVSQYFYIKKNVNNPLHQKVEDGGLSITEFVSSGIAVGMNNGQCRFLNGDLDEYEFGRCDQSLLDRVRKNIDEHFMWLGITERFDESIFLLYKIMGWRKQPFYIRENVSKSRISVHELGSEDLEVIKRYNAFDIDLYDFANELLDERISKIDGFYDELDIFKDMNSKLQRRWAWLPNRIMRWLV